MLTDLEELTLCSYCKQKYNDAEQCPKYLSCKHYFCLRCIENNLLKGRELFCAHCWKRTDLGDQGPDALPTHSSLLALTNNLSHLKITTNNTSGKTNDKERKVHTDSMNIFFHNVFEFVGRLFALPVHTQMVKEACNSEAIPR